MREFPFDTYNIQDLNPLLERLRNLEWEDPRLPNGIPGENLGERYYYADERGWNPEAPGGPSRRGNIDAARHQVRISLARAIIGRNTEGITTARLGLEIGVSSRTALKIVTKLEEVGEIEGFRQGKGFQYRRIAS